MATQTSPSSKTSDEMETQTSQSSKTSVEQETQNSPSSKTSVEQETQTSPSSKTSDEKETQTSQSSKTSVEQETQTSPSSKPSNELLDLIRATHANVVDRAVDLKPILQTMGKILLDVERVINGLHRGTVTLKKNTSLPALDHGMPEAMDDIRNVSGELSCNCKEKEDATTLKLLKMLKDYSWNTKALLALAAFTANFGEFWLLVVCGNTNSLANSVAFLWHVSEIEHLNALREVTELVHAIRNLAECNASFMMKTHSWYFSKEISPNSEAESEIILATYWTIDRIVRIARILSWRNKNTKLTTEERKKLIIQMEKEVSQTCGTVKNHFERCNQHIDEKRKESYNSLIKHMQKQEEGVIVEFLQKFLGIEKVNTEKLRNKYVLFFISGLDISVEEIVALNELYKKAKTYKIVWLLVVDGLYDEHKFLKLKENMNWYIDVPPILEPAVIKYIKEVWHFVKNPIAVLLTPAGEVACQNALPLLWTLGNEAFPFTAEKEKNLWPDIYDWRLNFLVDDLIDLEITEGRLICLFGGGSIDWILDFTEIKAALERIEQQPVEMVFVGKSAKQSTGEVITKVKRSHNSRVLKSERHFWARLQSMLYLYTKMRQGGTLAGDYPFMKEVMKILAYDGSGGGWALFCKGADEIVRMEGETAWNIILKNSDWENYAKKHGVLEAFNHYMEGQNIPHSCVRLTLPFISSEVPGKVQCCECGQEMEMYYMYRCCKE